MSRAGFTLGEAVLLASSSSMIFFLGSDLFGEVVQPPAMGEPEKLLLLLLVKLSALDVGESSNRFQSVLVLLMLGLSLAKEDEICSSNLPSDPREKQGMWWMLLGSVSHVLQLLQIRFTH